MINSKSPKIFIDPKTNQAVQLVDSKRHTFFFIPVRYWGIIYSGIGIYALIKGGFWNFQKIYLSIVNSYN